MRVRCSVPVYKIMFIIFYDSSYSDITNRHIAPIFLPPYHAHLTSIIIYYRPRNARSCSHFPAHSVAAYSSFHQPLIFLSLFFLFLSVSSRPLYGPPMPSLLSPHDANEHFGWCIVYSPITGQIRGKLCKYGTRQNSERMCRPNGIGLSLPHGGGSKGIFHFDEI